MSLFLASTQRAKFCSSRIARTTETVELRFFFFSVVLQ